MKKSLLLIAIIALSQSSFAQIIKEFKIEKQYLNFPISKSIKRQKVKFVESADTLTYAVISIADKAPDYWVFKDVSNLKGKTLKLVLSKQVSGIDQIYQSDTLA